MNSIKSLTNLEGRVDFLFEDLNLNTSAADSTSFNCIKDFEFKRNC